MNIAADTQNLEIPAGTFSKKALYKFTVTATYKGF
jgi:hypothetical protein